MILYDLQPLKELIYRHFLKRQEPIKTWTLAYQKQRTVSNGKLAWKVRVKNLGLKRDQGN